MTGLLYAGVTLWLLVCAILDWRTRRIPLFLTLPVLVAGAAWAVGRGQWWFPAFWGLLYLLWWLHALGGGDARLLMALTALRPDGSTEPAGTVETVVVLLGVMALGGAAVLLWNAAHTPRPVLLAAMARLGAEPKRALAQTVADSLDRQQLAQAGRWRATWAILIGWLALWALACV